MKGITITSIHWIGIGRNFTGSGCRLHDFSILIGLLVVEAEAGLESVRPELLITKIAK